MGGIPKGATHFSVVYDIVNFYKHAIERYCFEFEPEGEEFWAWFWWNGRCWEKDYPMTRNFKAIEDYATA